MFYHKKGRFYAELTPRRLSFAIPDGCWLNTIPDVESRYLLPLSTEAMDVTIELDVSYGDMDDVREELRNYLDTGCVGDPAPITVNGLKGYSAIFKGEHVIYYIVFLDISPFDLLDEEEERQMTRMIFAVSMETDADVDAVISCREVQEALNSIRVE